MDILQTYMHRRDSLREIQSLADESIKVTTVQKTLWLDVFLMNYTGASSEVCRLDA